MVEEQKKRLDQEFTKLVDDLDRSHLRKMQLQMHQCAAKCCEDQTSSMDGVRVCVERCSRPLERAQQFVHHEIEQFNERLRRCIMDCNDEVRDKVPANPTDKDIAKYTAIFEKCSLNCVNKHLDLLPNTLSRMKSSLKSGSVPDV